MKQLLNSKKAQMTIAGIIVTALMGLLASWQIDMPEEVKLALIKVIAWIIGILIMVYVGGQAYADGKSGGVTSSNYDPVRSVETVLEISTNLFKSMKDAGFELKQKRQTRKSKDEPKPQADPEITT